MRDPIRVVVADDHPTFREGLKRLLETQADWTVVGTAADGQEAIAAVERLNPDLALLDLAMPRMDGLGALRELRDRSLRAHGIVVTAAIEKAEIASALQLGARGVVLKDSASDVLFKCIRTVMAGQYWVGRNRITDIGATVRELSASVPRPSRKYFGLTSRELEIVGVILSGYSNGDIAARFSISEKTVKHHLTNIFDKVGVSNRLELALFALHHKIGMPCEAPPVPTMRAEAVQ